MKPSPVFHDRPSCHACRPAFVIDAASRRALPALRDDELTRVKGYAVQPGRKSKCTEQRKPERRESESSRAMGANMKTSRGIVWIDGAMSVMQQMTLELKNGWANLKINFSWPKAAQGFKGCFPSSWPCQQIALELREKLKESDFLFSWWKMFIRMA
jgi:hypothetical protein